MDYIFAESMSLFKMSFWSFFNLLDEDVLTYTDEENAENDEAISNTGSNTFDGIDLTSDENLYMEIFIASLVFFFVTTIIIGIWYLV